MSWPFPASSSTKSLPGASNPGRNIPGRSEVTPPQRSRSFSSRPAPPPPIVSPVDLDHDSLGPSSEVPQGGTTPPSLPPKDSPISPNDPLLRAVRMKMSSLDQEAMRKIRNSMVDLGDGSGFASVSRPPSTAIFPTMSVFPDPVDLTPIAGPSRPNAATSDDGDLATTSAGGRIRRSTLPRQVTGCEDGSTIKLVPQTHAEISQAGPAKYRIAVIGHAGTGKTTLINRAFRQYGVTEPVHMALQSGHDVQMYRSTVMPSGKIKLVSECKIVEMVLATLPIQSGSSIGTRDEIFPKELSGVDGVLVVYDSTSMESFEGVAMVAERLAGAGLPTIVFACKTEEEEERKVEPEYANSCIQSYNVGLIEVTTKTSEGRSKMRNGLRYLLLKMESRASKQRRQSYQSSSISPSSQPAISNDNNITQNHRMMWHEKGGHERNFSLGTSSVETGETASKRASVASESSTGSLHWMLQGPLVPKTNSYGSTPPDTATRSSRRSMPRTTSSSAEPLSAGCQSAHAESVESHASSWVPLEELLNQLFAKIVSTNDDAFVRAFFMCYRRFYLPGDLMALFLNRLKEVEGYETSRTVKHWALQKLTGALIDWTGNNIGDLADTTTRVIFQEIISLLLKHTFMAHLTAELVVVEESLLEDMVDIDASWALKPTGHPQTVSMALPTDLAEVLVDGELVYDYDTPSLGHQGIDSPSTKRSTPSLRTVSTNSVSVEERLGTLGLRDREWIVGRSHESIYRNVDDGQGQWAGAVGYILTVEPKVLAAELTKAQWQLFFGLRARDVFRHDIGKESDGPVARSVSFFNHVARWTSTLLLAETKPKHRARIYERFMLIAYHLRRFNNYESLCAVLSGMNETSVARLAQTHALVQASPEVFKAYGSNKKLMDAANGYATYKLALSSDFSNGKPAIPLMMTILPLFVRLQSMRPEDLREDGNVQWNKFQRFEEILRVIPVCQARGAPIPGQPTETFTAILQDTPVLEDEDKLYERSRTLEPAGSRGATPGPVSKMLGRIAL